MNSEKVSSPILNNLVKYICLFAILQFNVHISKTIIKSAILIGTSFHDILIILAISLH